MPQHLGVYLSPLILSCLSFGYDENGAYVGLFCVAHEMTAMLSLDGHLESGSAPAALHWVLRPCCRQGRERGGLKLFICSPVNNLVLVGDKPLKLYKRTNQNPNSAL